MEVNDLLVENLARLANLGFSPEEKTEIKNDLQQMTSFIEKLQEVDTRGGPPQLHMSTGLNVLREDIVRGSVNREAALRQAPDSNEQFFRVPKVINK